ncbi:hypothetical protein J7M22_00620, partial [Candidatus Poribacteria bacterium]|nr:hypothetical protein [Candidatus Poribacteria bacterium]
MILKDRESIREFLKENGIRDLVGLQQVIKQMTGVLIKELGRRLRKRGLKRRGRGRYQADRPPIIALILRGGYRIVFSAKRATKAT